MFLAEGKLLAQKQHLGTQGRPGRKGESQKPDALGGCSNKDQKQRSEQLHSPEHGHLWNDTFKSSGKVHVFLCVRTFFAEHNPRRA